jgi:hypothetical protein
VSLFAGRGRTGKQVKNLLNGTWLGHPAHPALTDIPIGAWTTTLAGHGRAEGAYVGSDRCTTGLRRHRPGTGMMRVRQQPGLRKGQAAGGCAW